MERTHEQSVLFFRGDRSHSRQAFAFKPVEYGGEPAQELVGVGLAGDEIQILLGGQTGQRKKRRRKAQSSLGEKSPRQRTIRKKTNPAQPYSSPKTSQWTAHSTGDFTSTSGRASSPPSICASRNSSLTR